MSSLVEEIASFSNLLCAWKTIRSRLTQEEYLFFFFDLARRYAKGGLKLLDIKSSLTGWLGYAGFANTYNFRRNLFADFRLKREPS